MKIRMYVALGLVGCKQQGDIQLDEDEAAEWAAMTDDEKHEYMREPLETFLHDHAESWWEEV